MRRRGGGRYITPLPTLPSILNQQFRGGMENQRSSPKGSVRQTSLMMSITGAEVIEASFLVGALGLGWCWGLGSQRNGAREGGRCVVVVVV